MRPRSSWLSVLVLGLSTAGCGSTVVIEGEGRGDGETLAPLQGKTQIATMRDGEVIVADALGNHVVGWKQTTFFAPLGALISPNGGEIGFGARPDQYDPDYAAIAGPIGTPTTVPGATPMGDMVPLGQGIVAWRQNDGIRITDRSGTALPGDHAASTSSLQLVPARDGQAVYFAGGTFGQDVVHRVDVATGEVRTLGATEVYGDFDVNAGGEAVGVTGYELTIIDDAGNASLLCTFEDHVPENPQWSPDGARVVVDADRPDDPGASRDVFVCERTNPTPIRITDDELPDRYPVFDDTSERIVWTRAGDLVAAPADGSADPEVLIRGGFTDSLDVAWLR